MEGGTTCGDAHQHITECAWPTHHHEEEGMRANTWSPIVREREREKGEGGACGRANWAERERRPRRKKEILFSFSLKFMYDFYFFKFQLRGDTNPRLNIFLIYNKLRNKRYLF
jgi:hypothetical protein